MRKRKLPVGDDPKTKYGAGFNRNNRHNMSSR
jgi:hypothetical protein